MSNEYFNQGYSDGVNLACTMINVPNLEPIKSKNYNDTILTDPTMQLNLCKVACAVLNDGEDDYVKILYNELHDALENKSTTLTKEASESILSPVIEAIGSHSIKWDANMMVKKAESNFFEALQSLMKSGLTVGAAGGVSVGALAWLLNRSSNLTDEEIDAKREQARHYREIANDIRERLKAKEGDIKNSIKSMSEGAYLL